MIVRLSPVDGHSYYVSIEDTVEFIHESPGLRETLEWANDGAIGEPPCSYSIYGSSKRASFQNIKELVQE